MSENNNNKVTEDKNKKCCRDKNGHFAKHCDKKAECKKEDPNTVKIHIVKDTKPLPPKDFEGRLEDVKERTAINFIHSVIARKPDVIDFDGVKYYSENVRSNLQKELDYSVHLNEEATECLKKAEAYLKRGEEREAELRKEYDKVNARRGYYKAALIGIALGVIACAVSGIVSSVSKSGRAETPMPIVEQTAK